ncbi:hypothetical protein CP532_1420 [Ophiocordyceps camponoti-leonardi (nom. inval.)]|nr:hypothetical protein CP532_1420 [Ophiocordyceps camponoti-leonardi (nom. inval.)]
MSFSHSAGGTLALPSPTHAHHMDVTSAVRSLRRSISKSPSKLLSRTNSQSSDSSRQASPQSPCRRRFGSTPSRPSLSPSHPQTAPPAVTSAHAAAATNPPSTFTPLRPSVRLSLRSAKSAKTSSPSRPLTRARHSPKSPLKRALGVVPDSGNASHLASPWCSPSPGQENGRGSSLGATTPKLKHVGKSNRHSVHLDVSGAASQYSFLNALDSTDSYMVPTTGALKRSDATMNLDHPNQGSPVAKRRSLHGISSIGQAQELEDDLGSSLAASQSFEIHEDSPSDEYELTGAPDLITGPGDDGPPSPAAAQRDLLASPSPASNMPKRSSSLRRSTLQQRHGEKGSLGRRNGERQLAQMTPETSTPPRNRPRLSTDHFMPPPAGRDGSPFSTAPTLSHPSVHATEAKGHHQPHPLSKTLTTSTSGNSLNEEAFASAPSADRAPPDKSKPHPFSRSLPVNAARPAARPAHEHHFRGVATPNHSRLWVGAFHSTGLVSKVNRNPEEDEKKIAPPDTPCKKHANPFATFPPPAGSALKRKGHNRNSFAGVPSTPFGRTPGRGAETLGAPGKGLSIFQRGSALNHSRRGSVLGLDIDSDDRMLFGESGELFGNLLDGDAPPTPTKNVLSPSLSNLSEQSLESPSANRTFSLPPLSTVKPEPAWRDASSTRSDPLGRPKERDDDAMLQGAGGRAAIAAAAAALDRQPSPTPCLAPRSSFGRSRLVKGLNAPSPLAPQSPRLTIPRSENAFSKLASADAAGSTADGRRTPQTPLESMLPLDTSRLSISQAPDGLGESNRPPPVTPTAGRDLRSSTSSFVTPVNARTSSLDVDISLSSRFDKIEHVGKGEFSTVYRVTRLEMGGASGFGSVTPSDDALSLSPTRGQHVYAVKKSRHPYTGQRDREIKLREVAVLRSLTHAEHVVRYVDSWEYDFHLYIQTEFCEEGTLAQFLGKVGRGGRLDDFRIFKILQDLCLGLKEIHHAGFMHLDMKPANILISFEGALKIGDFGLAQFCLSSSEDVDVEGDREYMAPEMLEGRAGPPADIFSLGLMTLEAAANVVLPENGPTWVALRSGDLSEVPSLTWTPSIEVPRDATGQPPPDSSDELKSESPTTGRMLGYIKRSELHQPPDFMVESFHPSSLDSIVRWMTAEIPDERPLVDDVLELEGLRWVTEHRNAPATVYEGSWGPAETFAVSIAGDDSDTEMTDV